MHLITPIYARIVDLASNSPVVKTQGAQLSGSKLPKNENPVFLGLSDPAPSDGDCIRYVSAFSQDQSVEKVSRG